MTPQDAPRSLWSLQRPCSDARLASASGANGDGDGDGAGAQTATAGRAGLAHASRGLRPGSAAGWGTGWRSNQALPINRKKLILLIWVWLTGHLHLGPTGELKSTESPNRAQINRYKGILLMRHPTGFKSTDRKAFC